MKFRILAAPLVGAVCLFVAAVPASAQDDHWSPEQIKHEWVGKKLLVRIPNGQLMDLWFKDGGGLEIAGNNFTDTGVWRLNDEGYCAKWQKIRNGEERCFTVRTRLGHTTVYSTDGSPSGTIVRVVAP